MKSPFVRGDKQREISPTGDKLSRALTYNILLAQQSLRKAKD